MMETANHAMVHEGGTSLHQHSPLMGGGQDDPYSYPHCRPR